jgi:hypothetical protein
VSKSTISADSFSVNYAQIGFVFIFVADLVGNAYVRRYDDTWYGQQHVSSPPTPSQAQSQSQSQGITNNNNPTIILNAPK